MKPRSVRSNLIDYGTGDSIERSKRNVPALLSLLMGLLFFIPVIAGVGAIVFGIIGLRRCRGPSVRGRGFAIVGLLLGAISFLVWIYPVSIFAINRIEGPAAQVACSQFISYLNTRNEASARLMYIGSTPDEITSDSQKLARLGLSPSISIWNCQVIGRLRAVEIDGDISGTGGKVEFVMFLEKHSSAFEVVQYEIHDTP